jgi:hypothetical protein
MFPRWPPWHVPVWPSWMCGHWAWLLPPLLEPWEVLPGVRCAPERPSGQRELICSLWRECGVPTVVFQICVPSQTCLSSRGKNFTRDRPYLVWGLVDGATGESSDCQRLFCPLPKCHGQVGLVLMSSWATEGVGSKVGLAVPNAWVGVG